MNFRPDYSFIDDCLDAYIVTACTHLLKLSDIDQEPAHKQALFDVLSDEEKYKYISEIAQQILDKYIKLSAGIYIYFHMISKQTMIH